MHWHSDCKLDSAGALELLGQKPSLPPEQYSFGPHGVHGVLAAALPSYPGRQTHWEMLVAPSGEVELAGHERTVGAETAEEDVLEEALVDEDGGVNVCPWTGE